MPAYLAGPISNMPDHNKPAFIKVAKELRLIGYKVVNPIELDGDDFSQPWETYMRRDLTLLLRCDAVFFLEGWRNSRGARVEYFVAKTVGIPCYCAHSYKKLEDNLALH